MAGGQGGGAWKVAYADFVTAMMALFMVLWISAQEEEILLSTSQYFQNPFNSPLDQSSGVMPYSSNDISQTNDSGGTSSSMVDIAFLHSLANELLRLLNIDEDDDSRNFDIQVTSDGLRITVFDQAGKRLFQDGTTDFTPWGSFVMQNLAWLIDRHQMKVRIDAHASSSEVNIDPEYGLWELTADQANSTRRALVHFALSKNKIERVTGFADTRPLPDYSRASAINQRIEISLVIQ